MSGGSKKIHELPNKYSIMFRLINRKKQSLAQIISQVFTGLDEF